MTLEQYLEKHDISIGEFAAAVGIEHHETARRYVRGERKPRDPEIVKAILKFTRNKVTLADIYGLNNV